MNISCHTRSISKLDFVKIKVLVGLLYIVLEFFPYYLMPHVIYSNFLRILIHVNLEISKETNLPAVLL